MDLKLTGTTIADLRKAKGYTQEALAEKLDISPQAVSKWETGVGLPEITLLIKLSDLLNVSLDELLHYKTSKNRIQSFINRNLFAPENKLLESVPRISRWNPPDGCDMFYSMPAMIAEALCCIEAYEKTNSYAVPYETLNARFDDLLHITGIGYGFLWEDDRHVIEELWHIGDYAVMVDMAMRYYGRDYLWLCPDNASTDDMKKAVVWSIDRGHPVVMEGAGCCPEFNIVTGYENNGDTLIGYTYCEECANKINEYGMFVNPARWDENKDWNILIIGDKITPSYTDKDTLAFALEVLNIENPQHKEIKQFKYTAGEAALQKWLDNCDTPEHALNLIAEKDLFSYALKMNTIYTQNHLLHYYKRLSESNSGRVNDIVIQIGIAIGIITEERNQIEQYRSEPDTFLIKAREHIQHIIDYRNHLRGWITNLQNI